MIDGKGEKEGERRSDVDRGGTVVIHTYHLPIS